MKFQMTIRVRQGRHHPVHDVPVGHQVFGRKGDDLCALFVEAHLNVVKVDRLQIADPDQTHPLGEGNGCVGRVALVYRFFKEFSVQVIDLGKAAVSAVEKIDGWTVIQRRGLSVDEQLYRT